MRIYIVLIHSEIKEQLVFNYIPDCKNLKKWFLISSLSWEEDNWHRLLLEDFLWKKFHDFTAETVKAFVPHFEVQQDGFIQRPCDADLVFCSWVFDLRKNTLEKTQEDLLRKCL